MAANDRVLFDSDVGEKLRHFCRFGGNFRKPVAYQLIIWAPFIQIDHQYGGIGDLPLQVGQHLHELFAIVRDGHIVIMI